MNIDAPPPVVDMTHGNWPNDRMDGTMDMWMIYRCAPAGMFDSRLPGQLTEGDGHETDTANNGSG